MKTPSSSIRLTGKKAYNDIVSYRTLFIVLSGVLRCVDEPLAKCLRADRLWRLADALPCTFAGHSNRHRLTATLRVYGQLTELKPHALQKIVMRGIMNHVGKRIQSAAGN